MVGVDESLPFGSNGLFSGAFWLVSGRVNELFQQPFGIQKIRLSLINMMNPTVHGLEIRPMTTGDVLKDCEN